MAKKTTKNHPRIKYSIKQPLGAGQPTTTAQSMASLVNSISTAPIILNAPKTELLNFTMARKFGNKVYAAAAEPEPRQQTIWRDVGQTEQIYIKQQMPTEVKISKEELQTSVISELGNYEIEEIELNPYPDSADATIDRDSHSQTMFAMSSVGDDSKCSADDIKFSFQGSGGDVAGDDDPDKGFECRHCGKKYRWKSTLRRHENVECGGKEPAYQCPHCSYKAKQRGNLGVHIRKHHGDLPQLESRRKNRSM